MPIVMFLTTSDIMRPDQNSCISLARCRAACHGFDYPAPMRSPVAFLPCTNPRVGHRDGRRKTNMNTLAQAEVRRNRLKNNTTRLSPHQIRRFAIVGINANWPVIPLKSTIESGCAGSAH